MAPLPLPAEFDRYPRILPLDAEFTPRAGQLPDPICYAVGELRSGAPARARWVRNCDPGPCPYDPERDLILCYSAEAELSFFRACGWPMPKHVYDLWVAFRLYANGRLWHSKMLDALEHFKIPHATSEAQKNHWQQVCADGGPEVDQHATEILRYCASDIADLGQLLEKLAAEVDNQAVLRWGEYVAHAVRVFERGMPVDMKRLQLLVDRWDEALLGTVILTNHRMSYGLYGSWHDPLYRSYQRTERLWHHLQLDSNWERTPTGLLRLDQETLKSCEGRHPYVALIRQTEKLLNVAHPRNIAVGPDERCRTPERAFAALTSRSLMKAQTPLAYPGGMRAVMVPEEGTAMLVGDLAQADPGVAGALAGDLAILVDYTSPKESPDFYMAFGSRVGAFPRGAIRRPEIEPVRNKWKRVVNGILYGVGPRTLSFMLGCELGEARHKIRAFNLAYPSFKRWAKGRLQLARIDGFLSTEEGWIEHAVRGPAAINFPIQSVVAQITRLSSLNAEAAGLPVIFSLHDSVGIHVRSRDTEDAALELARCMSDAAFDVIGFRLRVDVQKILGGTRWFKDDKARDWWFEISKVLGIAP